MLIKKFCQKLKEFKMAKKLFLVWFVFCAFSAFAGDIWDSIVSWAEEESMGDSVVNGCTFSPDGVYYNPESVQKTG
jgi:hypothetical protein